MTLLMRDNQMREEGRQEGSMHRKSGKDIDYRYE